ncbi:hypothetical protein GZH79_18785 [Loktanella sp. SALINAS62]|nr:hypothetical protein [Loktanella sp. SALINAS62]
MGIKRDLLTRARAADIALSAGVVTNAATGLADMRQIHGRDRRTGLVHAALNSTTLSLTVTSLVLRRRGRGGAGRALNGEHRGSQWRQ